MRSVVALLVAGILTVPAIEALAAPATGQKPTYRLENVREPGRTDRVVVTLEAGGELIEKPDDKVRREKMSVVCNLRYDEKTLEVPSGSTGRWRSVRHYDTASAVIKVAEDGLKPTLRDEHRLICAEIDSHRAILFCPRGPLTRDELELIDVQGNSLLLDRFLPEGPVAVGAAWKHSDNLMAALLGLDAVGHSDVKSVLSEVTATVARMTMTGRVEGAVYGISTEIELKAKYRYDRRRKRIDWFGLLVKEKRNPGRVTDGVDVVCRTQVLISPKADGGRLADAALADLPSKAGPALQELVFESAEGGWQFRYDRNWHVYRDSGDLAVLRMLDRGEFVAQCNVSSLQKVAPGRQTTLDKFQRDVRRALGDNFGEFVEAGQRANQSNYRVYRVLARGKVEELPIQWRYYLVADEHGRQAVFAFTVEGALAERFDEADRRLLGAFRFVEPKTTISSAK